MARDKLSRGSAGPLGGIFFLAYIGAAVYFVQHAHSFWGSIWGLLEAIFWPAFMVYHGLALMHVLSL